MRYIDSWLTGLGLEYIIPKLKANGITTPKKLAQLTLRDMYDVVGVEDAEDRKKLYFLIQRLHTVSISNLVVSPPLHPSIPPPLHPFTPNQNQLNLICFDLINDVIRSNIYLPSYLLLRF